MINFSFNRNGETKTVTLNKYQDLLRLVVNENVQDNEFNSMEFVDIDEETGETHIDRIEGLGGLCAKALQVADDMDAADAALEAMAALEDDEDYEDYEN